MHFFCEQLKQDASVNKSITILEKKINVWISQISIKGKPIVHGTTVRCKNTYKIFKAIAFIIWEKN